MASENHPSPALRALRRGDISLRTYLRERLALAMAPLVGELTPDQFRSVRKVVQARLLSDPVLGRYWARVTQHADDVGVDAPPPSRPDGVG